MTTLIMAVMLCQLQQSTAFEEAGYVKHHMRNGAHIC